MKKYWTKTGRKARRANSRPCISMFDVEMFFGFPTHFSFVDWNILLSSGILPQSVGKSSHRPGISNILGSPIQSRILFHSFMQGSRWSSMQVYSWHTQPALAAFVSLRERFHSISLISLALKKEPSDESYQVLLLARGGTWPIHSNPTSSIFCF